jgi:hypothetical protein
VNSQPGRVKHRHDMGEMTAEGIAAIVRRKSGKTMCNGVRVCNGVCVCVCVSVCVGGKGGSICSGRVEKQMQST